ncbi:hypothetical protein J6524_04600 [Bradyrhizobium sp. WSM 1738]|uniref:hypothetical protein n=1 Tax=Bradyrhizobium hereditatis TaxID=2821405 RepID=UPI001CE26716|nr:hypothetical protein [Bradyrhizobium hereditatis]MCA6114208.1 hypothetical protein [Bradyrhizobium hereditatis]
MLRWMTPILVAIFAAGTAAAQSPGATQTGDGPAAAKPADPPAAAAPADNPATAKPKDSPAAAKPAKSPAAVQRAEKAAAGRRAAALAASQLPPGLPRAHYNYRTTVAPAAPPLYVRRGRTLVVEEEDPDVLFTPTSVVPYAPRVFGTPLLPGSSTLPGYYGTSHSYSYDGPYYGGPYEPYWNRLPYACGVYGYC